MDTNQLHLFLNYQTHTFELHGDLCFRNLNYNVQSIQIQYKCKARSTLTKTENSLHSLSYFTISLARVITFLILTIHRSITSTCGHTLCSIYRIFSWIGAQREGIAVLCVDRDTRYAAFAFYILLSYLFQFSYRY